jgi:hypothetical protein
MTTPEAVARWQDANQRELTRAVARVARRLDGKLRVIETAGSEDLSASSLEARPSALETLTATFGLSPFERDILLLCAGIELDSDFALRCAVANGDDGRAYPTFGLALAVLENAHWSALAPSGPLRYWRLIEISSGHGLTQAALRIDERVLHFLTGVQHLDERLVGIVEDVILPTEGLAATQEAVSAEAAAVLARLPQSGMRPLVQLLGSDAPGKRAVALAAAAAAGIPMKRIDAATMPVHLVDLEVLIRAWQREVALTGSGLVVDCDDVDEGDAARSHAIRQLVDRVGGPLIVTTRDRRPDGERPSIAIEVGLPTSTEQAAIWRQHLGQVDLNGAIDTLVSQFDLSAPLIHAAAAELAGTLTALPVDEFRRDDAEAIARRLWDVCRAQVRPRMEALARRIEPTARWDDIVLPPGQLETLRELAVHVRRRGLVYGEWGFAAKHGRGLGVSALFAGPSGTGKTMAAEVIANELRLDLFHIDLSQVVSKYIGETEKNLRKVFDAAEGSAALLLFDEADALFGKRSEVSDSHDRYANIEVSYLLQRMEAYRGLAILTTNMKEALDPAFLRRIRFVVQFPFPDVQDRMAIWRGVFPKATPTRGLAPEKLARLNLSGGNIWSIALNAAFLAADDGGVVEMRHLADAARREFMKLERPISEAELASWA